jgi:uncharacterized protein
LKFTRELTTAIMIRSVSDSELMIGDIIYKGTVALTSDKILATWCDRTVAELRPEDFETLLETNPEIVILGTGPSNVFAPRELVFALARRNVGLEVMDTKAAARTFNVLAGEGRQIAAVLYL